MGVKLRTYTFQHHSLKSVIGLNHTRFSRETLHMAYLRIISKSSHHTVSYHNRMGFVRTDRIQISYLNMRPESYDFISHLTFKPDNYRHRNNHHSQANSNTRHGNEDRRT